MGNWYSQTKTLRPGLNDVYFEKTPNYPNVFYVTNNASTPIYIGVVNIPSRLKFDVCINGYSSDIFGRPFEIERISILNDSVVDINITIHCDNINFDFNLLKTKMDCYITGIKDGTQFDVINDAFDKLNNAFSGTCLKAKTYHSNKVISGTVTDNFSLDIQYRHINIIANDSDSNDALITINGSQFTLKPKEVIQNFDVDGISLTITGDNLNCRYLLRGV